jgi:hypothetical protein
MPTLAIVLKTGNCGQEITPLLVTRGANSVVTPVGVRVRAGDGAAADLDATPSSANFLRDVGTRASVGEGARPTRTGS